MIDPENVPDVHETELLTRFLLSKSHIRADGTIKPNAFIPHPYEDLSVNRHRDATEAGTWSIGHAIARNRNDKKTLKGRADIIAIKFIKQRLKVEADPIEGNPNHAIVLRWPKEKPAQKAIALEICKDAKFVTQNHS